MADSSSYLSNSRTAGASRRRGRSGRAPRDSVDTEQLLALFAAKDLEALIDTSFGVLRTAVRCDFASAFYRSAGRGLLKQRDSRGREYGPAFMRRYVELTPAIPLAMANRGVKIQATRKGLPSAELEQTAFYREIMQPQGWRHAVALCFWGDPPADFPIFVASVFRSEKRTDFTERDVAGLERVHQVLDAAVNRVHEREAANTLRDGMAVAVRDKTGGVAILDRSLAVVQSNAVARQFCAAWAHDAAGETAGASSRAWRLPPALTAACHELRDEWQSLLRVDPDAVAPRRREVLSSPVPDLRASITMVCPDSNGLAEPTFVLELDRIVHGVALEPPDGSAPVLQKLTTAERAVAMVLADGFSNQEIADRLGKTVHAVKFLLHRIYGKTGIPSRAALVAVLRSRSGGSKRRKARQPALRSR
jgi:DNA-binding CsgD family transcriptional regulator